MRFVKERIKTICKNLKKLITVKALPAEEILVKEGCFNRPEEADASETEWKKFDSNSDHWYGTDRHYWFRTSVTIPDEMDKKSVWLKVYTQVPGNSGCKNPQFLIFVDGEVRQGMDLNHKEILLDDCATKGKTYRIDLQAYSGTEFHELTLNIDLEQRDSEIKDIVYDLLVPVWSLDRMDENDRNRYLIEEAVTECANLIDTRVPYSEDFYASIRKAREYAKTEIYEKLCGENSVVATCIGHTHIDVAWLWTVDQVRQKSARSFATVIKLMEEYPDYKFMSSQPQLYEFVKERYPELYEKIKERVKEGRWEPEGGMWVEADCNLPSGESLVRQFMVGKKFFRDEFGKENRILWLPDVFGYNGALPQIMKKCGIEYFMTTKLAWNQINKFPHDTFMWEGIDGTEILTHLITTTEPGQDKASWFTTYNGELHPETIMGGWERYTDKEINNDIMVSYGFGDGGGGPTRYMLENYERMKHGINSTPVARQAFPSVYFDELNERLKNSKRIPHWVGELYFEYHRGTYTSMGRNKRANRKSEYRMMELELLSVMLENKLPYPKKELDAMWKIILRNQFHDILPGSSIAEVYEVTKKEYEEITELSEQLIGDRLKAYASENAEEYITLFNPLGMMRDDIASVNLPEGKALFDGVDTYPVQKTEDGSGIVYVRNLPSKGFKGYKVVNGSSGKSEFDITDRRIETPYYIVTFDDKMRMTKIFDKDNGRDVIKPGCIANELRMFEDKPMHFSNWDIDMYYTEKSWEIDDLQSSEWIEKGPVRATLRVTRRVGETIIRQDIRFYANDRRIDFDTYINWQFSEHLLKCRFPVDVHTDEATFDIQFGNLTRKIHRNTSWDEARFESCGHKWADMSEGNYGVALMNDCKYGYSAIDGVLSLTLIKSGTDPNPRTDREEHYMTYSLYPHAGTWRQSDLIPEAFSLNVPLRAVNGGAIGETSFMSLDCGNVVLETVKRAEDGKGVIVRVYEVKNMRTRVVLKTGFKVNTAVETDMLENPIKDGNPELLSDNEIGFIIRPYEIKTFRIN